MEQVQKHATQPPASAGTTPTAREEKPPETAAVVGAIDAALAVQEKKPWKEMTRKEKRIAVAEDVLAQLEAKKLFATRGRYWMYNEEDYSTWRSSSGGWKSEWRQITKDGKVPCRACAIGSAFVACTRLADEDIGGFGALMDGSGMCRSINAAGVFSYTELREMEVYFEHTSAGSRSFGDAPERKHDSETALRKIMTHIINNDGNFDHKKLLIEDK